jgi:hypothetical protein
MVKTLAEEIGEAYEPALADLKAVLGSHISEVDQVLNMEESDRADAITSLAESTTQWLQERDERWQGLGSSLGKTVRLGLMNAFGI